MPNSPLSLNTLNIGQPPPRLAREVIQINGQPFSFYHPPGDDTIHGTLSCLQNNKFHLNEIPFVDGDVVVDIGCNVGLLGLVIARLFPSVNVYGFDASNIAVEAARAGAMANGLINYQAYNVAIGAVNQANIKFFSNGKDKSCLVEDGLNKDNKVPEISINKIKIDEIFDSPLLGIGKVKFLKMDIEGGEFEIFDRLFNHRPDIIDRIEYLHLEVHQYQEFQPAELEGKVKAKWGNKVFFDV